MPTPVQRCFSSTPRPNGGHRQAESAVSESPEDCFGRLRYPPGIPHVPVAEALHDKVSATRWFSARIRIRFEVKRRPVATELRTHCGSGSARLPLAQVRGAVCGLDKWERERQRSTCNRHETVSGLFVARCIAD